MVKKTDLARELRQRQTSYEALMWQHLRKRRFHGLKFHRQQPFGKYILDFFCEELRLAIELDGAQHLDPGVMEYDATRDEFLQSKGITVLHIDNQEIAAQPGRVFARIERVVEALRLL